MTNLNNLIRIDLFQKVKPINLSVKINTLLSLFKGNEEVLISLEKEFTQFTKDTTLKADIKRDIDSILHRSFYDVWMKRPIKIDDMILINTYFPQYVASQQHQLNKHIESSIGSKYKLEAKLITDVVLAIGQYRKNKPEDLMKIVSTKPEITEKDSNKYISLIRKHYIKGTLPVVTYLLEKYPNYVTSLHIPNETLLEESNQDYECFINAVQESLKKSSVRGKDNALERVHGAIDIDILSNKLTTTLLNVDLTDREEFKINIFNLCCRITRKNTKEADNLYNSLINIELVLERVGKDIASFLEYEFGIKEKGIEAIINVLKKCKDPIESIRYAVHSSNYKNSVKDIDEDIGDMIETISKVYLYKKLDKSIINDREEKKLKL